MIVSYSSARIPKQPLTSNNLYYKINVNGSEVFASPTFKVFNKSSVCESNETLSDLQSYDVGVSYGTIRDNGLFSPSNGSAIFVDKTGVLDFQSDISWPCDSSKYNKTYVRVLGAVGKSVGSANVSLRCVFHNISGGCTKIERGSLNFGTARGKETVVENSRLYLLPVEYVLCLLALASSLPVPALPTLTPGTVSPSVSISSPTTQSLSTSPPATTFGPLSSVTEYMSVSQEQLVASGKPVYIIKEIDLRLSACIYT